MTILHKKLDGLIVISNYLERYYKKSSQTINIPPLVDLSEEKWQVKSTKNNNIFTFVYAGSPEKKDKIDVFLKAIASTNLECNLNIVGITKKEYLVLYPDQELLLDNLKSRVNFIGRVSHITSLNYVKSADCSCFFRENNRSTKAGSPTKLAESISANTLVLTNVSSYVNQLGEFIDKIVEETNERK